MQVAWTGTESFGKWVSEAVAPSSSLEFSQAEPERCACLIVENDESVPQDFAGLGLFRIIDREKLSSLSETKGPVGTILIAGDEAKQNLRNLIDQQLGEQKWARLEEIVQGPLSHDMRGAIGIIHLVTQVLGQTEAGQKVSVRLSSAASKLQHLLEDFQVLTTPTTLPVQERDGTWQTIVEEIQNWHRAVHRKREVEVSLHPEAAQTSTSKKSAFIVRALLDANLRLTSAATPISLLISREGNQVVCRVESEIEPPDDDLRLFFSGSLAEHPTPRDQAFLFRLQKGAQLLRAWGGSISAEVNASRLRITATFPA